MSSFRADFICLIRKDFFEDDLAFHEAEVRIREQPYLRVSKFKFTNDGFKIIGFFTRPVVAYFFDILLGLGVENIQAVYNLYEDLDNWFYECGLKDGVFYKKNFVFSGSGLRELLLDLYKEDVSKFNEFILQVSGYIEDFSFDEVSIMNKMRIELGKSDSSSHLDVDTFSEDVVHSTDNISSQISTEKVSNSKNPKTAMDVFS